MLSINKLKSARDEKRPVLLLGVIFIAGILVMICFLSFMLLNQLKQLHPTQQQVIPVLSPTAALPKSVLPTASPTTLFSIRLPIILSVSDSVSEQIWRVTKIKNLGYELAGQRYDLATFTHIDGGDTAKGYCINRGWAVPEIGSKYLLTAEGIFVPLQEPEPHPYQRFLRIP